MSASRPSKHEKSVSTEITSSSSRMHASDVSWGTRARSASSNASSSFMSVSARRRLDARCHNKLARSTRYCLVGVIRDGVYSFTVHSIVRGNDYSSDECRPMLDSYLWYWPINAAAEGARMPL